MLQLCRVLLNSRLASRFLWCLSPVRLSLCLTTMLHQTRGPNWDPQCARRQWEVYVPSVTGATKATLTIPTCPGGSKGTGTSLFSSDAKLRFPHMNTSWVHVHTYTKHKIGIHMRKSTKTRACKKVTQQKEYIQSSQEHTHTPTHTHTHTRIHSNNDKDFKLKLRHRLTELK